jgi:prepilin-type N-terminal cleavage/methylation domain-containing protein/prepilin-type processing-associated H-X9-DG protein
VNAKLRQRGFSLTELLVVIAVIVIIAGMLIVGINQAYSHAMQAKCLHRLEQIGYAVRMYSTASHGALPKYWDAYTARHWYDVIGGEYLSDPAILVCPSVGGPPPVISAADIAENDPREHIEVIMKTLRWFKREQVLVGDDYGYWDSKNTYKNGYRHAVTGFVILAYLGMGCSDSIPSEFADVVRRGVDYLASATAQEKAGADVGRWKDSGKNIYGTSICVKALCEAARMVQDPGLRTRALEAAQLGMNWLVSKQRPETLGAYHYNAGSFDSYWSESANRWVHGGDTNATGWVYYAMGAALKRGLNVPASAVDLAGSALDNMVAPATAHNDQYGYTGSCTYTYDPVNGFGGGAWRNVPNTPVGMSAVMAMRDYVSTPDPAVMAGFLFRTNGGVPQVIKAMTGESGLGYHQYTTFYHTWHVCNSLRQYGGTYWDTWYAAYPPHITKELVPEGDDMGYFPAILAGGHSQSGGGTDIGDRYSTALASMILSFPLDYSWANQDRTFTVSECSYGYNNMLGANAGTPGADTVVVMDYHKSAVDRDEFEPEKNDTDADIPLRHGGRANVLFADGGVRALSLSEFKAGMFTPAAGD